MLQEMKHTWILPKTLKTNGAYADFITNHPGVKTRHETFMNNLNKWWDENVILVTGLAHDPANKNGNAGNVYFMRRSLLESIADKFAKQDILTSSQIRGAFANYCTEGFTLNDALFGNGKRILDLA